jgi:hypothetical protein
MLDNESQFGDIRSMVSSMAAEDGIEVDDKDLLDLDELMGAGSKGGGIDPQMLMSVLKLMGGVPA